MNRDLISLTLELDVETFEDLANVFYRRAHHPLTRADRKIVYLGLRELILTEALGLPDRKERRRIRRALRESMS